MIWNYDGENAANLIGSFIPTSHSETLFIIRLGQKLTIHGENPPVCSMATSVIKVQDF